jgi:hypothetical protein
MIAMFDQDRSGTINEQEFTGLYEFLTGASTNDADALPVY